MVNNLVGQAFIAALTEGKAIVDESCTRTAVIALTIECSPPRHRNPPGDTAITQAPPGTPGGAFRTQPPAHRQ